MRMKKRGIATIIEAVISSLLLIAAFSVGFYFITTTAMSHQRYSEDLTKVGYSLLSDLSANDGFDKLILFYPNGSVIGGWEQQLKLVINSLIPSNIIFNVTVYKPEVNNSSGLVDLTPLNTQTISNVSNETAFLKAGENSEVSYIYTTKDLHILVISMKLAILGGA